MEVLKVSSTSNPNSVAGALAPMLKKSDTVEIHAIGAGAVNQSVKAIAIVRSYVASLGYNVYCIPAFFELELEDENKSGIKFIVKKKY